MFDVKCILEKELDEQRKLKKIYAKKVKTLPNGVLSVSEYKGKRYYSKYQNGNRKYMGKETVQEVKDIQLYKLLEEMIKRIETNDVLISKILKEYKDPSPITVERELGKAYQNESGELLKLFGKKNGKDWGNQEYERYMKYPEKLVHRTLKGDFVRSKSEVILANTLFAKGLQYRYEEITEIGSHVLAPDFKVLIPKTNQIKIIEHFGMMQDFKYRKKAMDKMETYIEHGYRPYEDIIFTFDDLDGHIDAKNLDILITNFCLL